MLPSKIAFVDIETTGSSTHRDRILEIAVIRVENDNVKEKFQSLVNPEIYIPTEIENLTGISSQDVENAPTFRSLAKQLRELLSDCVFSAHNVRFDYGFIKREFAREEISFSAKNLCTVKLSRALYPKYKHHSLDDVISRFGFDCQNRHRAFDDAWILWEFYSKMLKETDKNKLDLVVSKVMKRPSLPLGLSEAVLDRLPESPGVYIFYGEGGMPLYVGKSINIRNRVLSHFASDHASSTEMKIAQQVHSIETIITSGELGALFKEAQLVKSLQPLYNRQLRKTRKMVIAKSIKVSDYLSIVLEEVDQIEADKLGDILGVFKSRKQAREFLFEMCQKNVLCAKLLGLENGSGECFGYRLGKCKGGCKNLENPTMYNGRFIIAFSANKFRPWPFKGAILVREEGENHIFNKWCYLGSRKENSEEINKEIKFDLDTYKILNRFLRNPNNQKKIYSSEQELARTSSL